MVNASEGTRVINSDALFLSANPDARLESDSDSDTEALLDGVFEGLKAEEVILEPQPSTEEILAQAYKDAERILAQAQADAIQIACDAKKQADLLYERTKLEAYKDGVSKLRLLPSGFGDMYPVASGNDADSLRKNRRIELQLTNR